MSTEKRAITVQAYRDPSGNPTCCVSTIEKLECIFVRAKRFGTVLVCAATGHELQYEADYLRPTSACPVWRAA